MTGIQDDEPVLKKIDLLSVHVISLVDRLCYLAPFNCRSTLEEKVHIEHRRLMERHVKSIFETDDSYDKFRDSWIEWLRSNPTLDDADGASSNTVTKLLDSMYGSSDEEGSSKGNGGNTGKGGAGLHDNDFLVEGADKARKDEDNARAAQEGEARLAAGGQAAARAAGPGVAEDE